MLARDRWSVPFLFILVGLLFASPAAAEDWGRRGWYAGLGAGTGSDFLDSVFEEATMGVVTVGTTGSFNARGGYRLLSWLALEAMYEGVYGIPISVAGTNAASFDTHSFLANGRLILPIGRFHPYFILGLGAQYGVFDGRGSLAGADLSRWDLGIRTGLGLDAYVTRNWLLNVELAPTIRVTDYGNIGSQITDNVSLTFSVGAQYRF
jgi:opacity protein-like surface antigen